MFKPLIGKCHPEFSIGSQQIDNGEDGVLYLDSFLRCPGGSPPTRCYKTFVPDSQVGVAQLQTATISSRSTEFNVLIWLCRTHVQMNSSSHERK